MQNYIEDIYRGTIKADEDGVYRGTGALSFLLNPFVDEDKLSSSKQQAAVRRQASALGEDINDLNLGADATVYDVQGAVSKKDRQRTKEAGETAHTRALETTMAPITAQLASQNLNAAEERDIRTKQFNLQMEQLRNDRIDAKEARADELEYARMRDRKEDLRYNESIERMDRKDRQQAIQTLVAGLANLGAAFAL